MNPIRVLLVDDSQVVLTILKRMLAPFPEVHVVGTAVDGREALAMIPTLEPDVICTDLEMPVMGGLEFTREVMAQFPRPVLVVSNYVHKEHEDNIFEVLEAGAVDVFPKPRLGFEQDTDAVARQLVSKIRIISGVVVFPKPRPSSKGHSIIVPTVEPLASPHIVVIGASTGGPPAYRSILGELPADFPVPVVCIQHISLGFLEGLVHWMKAHCRLNVEIARTAERPVAGTIYFAKEGVHSRFDSAGRFSFSSRPVEAPHTPSIDEMFESVAEAYGAGATGVILTGMGQDGAEGLDAIRQAGGITIAQDEKTSVIFGMPRKAIEIGAARYVLPLMEIPAFLIGGLRTHHAVHP